MALAKSLVPYLILESSIIEKNGCIQGIFLLTIPKLRPEYISLGPLILIIPVSFKL